MKRKILHSMLLLTLTVLLIAAVLFIRTSVREHAQTQGETLKREADILASMVTNGGAEAINAVGQEHYRCLLWLDGQGQRLAGFGTMSPTVVLEHGEAEQSGRDRDTAGTFAWQSVPLPDDSLLYFEVGETGYRHAMAQLFLWLIGLALLAVLGAIWLSSRTTKRLMDPLHGARLEDLEVQEVCEELQPLARRMLDQNRSIQKQLLRQRTELQRGYEKQDRTRRDFTANVSHELKTPLTSISGYAEILRAGLVREEDVTRFAGRIYDETQRLITLVGDILKLSQLDEGHQVVRERERVELRQVCQQVIASLQSAAEARQVQFTLNEEEAAIWGVPQIAYEIIYNLCDNAIKYNREGGSVQVSITAQGDRALLEVQDSGIGISQQEQERVFERFYRVDKSHSKEIGGTGLGLSIVKHGAAYHEAKVELESVLGQGTTFRVSFPGRLEPETGG